MRIVDDDPVHCGRSPTPPIRDRVRHLIDPVKVWVGLVSDARRLGAETERVIAAGNNPEHRAMCGRARIGDRDDVVIRIAVVGQ